MKKAYSPKRANRRVSAVRHTTAPVALAALMTFKETHKDKAAIFLLHETTTAAGRAVNRMEKLCRAKTAKASSAGADAPSASTSITSVHAQYHAINVAA